MPRARRRWARSGRRGRGWVGLLAHGEQPRLAAAQSTSTVGAQRSSRARVGGVAGARRTAAASRGPELSGGTSPVTIPGFAINPFGLDVPLSGGTSPVTIPGFAINPFGLDVPLSGGTSPVTIPGFAINPFIQGVFEDGLLALQQLRPAGPVLPAARSRPQRIQGVFEDGLLALQQLRPAGPVLPAARSRPQRIQRARAPPRSG